MEQDLYSSKPLFVHEQVRINKIKTVFLIGCFVVMIFGICYLFGYVYDNVALGFIAGAGYCAVVIPLQIKSSKSMMISTVHGRAVNENDPSERRVMRLVEGLSISAGLKEPPQVFIIPTQTPNAFAGGLKPENSYIGVTEGLLQLLDDSELEGVLGHEMAHIMQRDVLISTIAIALMSVIIFLANLFYRAMYRSGRRGSRNNNNNKNAAALLLIAIIVYLVANLLSKLINLAISRQREYAADASAVRLCSNSEGLASALEKIAGSSGKKYNAEEVSSLGGNQMLCLYIYNPKKRLLSLFSTHPPIEERIARVRNMY